VSSKRERRVMGLTGGKNILVKVIYRGALWFEGLEVDVSTNSKLDPVKSILDSKYLGQARVLVVDYDLWQGTSSLENLRERLGVPLVVMRDEEVDEALSDKVNLKGLCSCSNIPEALRVARLILNEIIESSLVKGLQG